MSMSFKYNTWIIFWEFHSSYNVCWLYFPPTLAPNSSQTALPPSSPDFKFFLWLTDSYLCYPHTPRYGEWMCLRGDIGELEGCKGWELAFGRKIKTNLLPIWIVRIYSLKQLWYCTSLVYFPFVEFLLCVHAHTQECESQRDFRSLHQSPSAIFWDKTSNGTGAPNSLD